MLRALALAMRALWWRRGQSVVVLLVATFAVTVAASGPLFLQGASESILRQALTTASGTSNGTGIEVTKDAAGRGGAGPLHDAVDDALAGTSLERAYPERVVGLERPTRLTSSGDRDADRVTVVARDGACGRLRMVTGRCPAVNAADEVAVSDADARRRRWTVGSRI